MSTAVDATIVIRTLNEAEWLPRVFEELKRQAGRFSHEVVLVDSGSTDGTVEIARRHGARIVFIKKEDFSFGRSLNVGCEAAGGKVLVFVSGHCIPVGEQWLDNLIAPVMEGACAYSYGRQIGHDLTKFSEQQLFEKFFPATSNVPNRNIFCNNANSALARDVWAKHRFDEMLTGLEDMELAKRLVHAGHAMGYVAEAPVIHIHDETWRRVRIRYEREAIALQHIMPEVQVSLFDTARWFVSGVIHDLGVAIRENRLLKTWREIVMFRAMQYWGTYQGNALHRKISKARREEYFYPAPRGAQAASAPAEILPHGPSGRAAPAQLKAAA
ncbi:glycosyltransferase family 2 protein [Sphingomonas sp. MMS24-J13]|uniref:glycosyltransferase family 2 protein n=1 Tax=Sphingomonas sp. MMS24-J13 TaxID=3238686 RepID=UPI00384D1503